MDVARVEPATPCLQNLPPRVTACLPILHKYLQTLGLGLQWACLGLPILAKVKRQK